MSKKTALLPAFAGDENDSGWVAEWFKAAVLKTAGLNSQANTAEQLTAIEKAVLAFCLAFYKQNSPDLAAVIEGWERLPEPIKAGIVAMVQTSAKHF